MGPDAFVSKSGELTLSMLEEDQRLENANNNGLKSMSEKTSNVHTFWIKVKAEYLETATKAMKSLLPFPRPYLCEAGYTLVTTTKTRLWSRLDTRNTRDATISIIPRWDYLLAGKAAQGSL